MGAPVNFLFRGDSSSSKTRQFFSEKEGRAMIAYDHSLSRCWNWDWYRGGVCACGTGEADGPSSLTSEL